MSYRDYVIKDGIFIGKFAEMYDKCADPWKQTELINHRLSISRNTAILHMKRLGINSVVEFGSGFGYYTKMIHDSGIRVLGVDIAPKAIDRAKNLFPHLDFEVGRIQDFSKFKKFDAFLLAEITWYILQDFDQVLKNLSKFKGKYLINNLVFYKGNQKYGVEFFTNLKEFIKYIPFKCISQMESTTSESDTVETTSIFKIT